MIHRPAPWSAARRAGLALVYLHRETGARFWRDDTKPRRERWHGEVAITNDTTVLVDGPTLRSVVKKLTPATIWIGGKPLCWPKWAGWSPGPFGYARAELQTITDEQK